jgi:Spy/CpxP family protein refolding chaperone
MIARRLGLMVLAVAFCFAWTGCGPAVPVPAERTRNRPPQQEKFEGRILRLDDDALRVRLLLLEAVRKDLGLTDGQTAELNRWIEIAKEEGRKNEAKLREIFPPGQYQEKEAERRERERRAFTEDMKKKAKDFLAKILAMLTPSQRERLKQIRLQASISAALERPEIVKALDISKEQSAEIRALRDRMEAKQLAATPNFRGLDAKQRRQKMIELMKASDKTWAEAKNCFLDILTPAQRAKFEKLQGRKIDVTWPYDQMVPEDVNF